MTGRKKSQRSGGTVHFRQPVQIAVISTDFIFIAAGQKKTKLRPLLFIQRGECTDFEIDYDVTPVPFRVLQKSELEQSASHARRILAFPANCTIAFSLVFGIGGRNQFITFALIEPIKRSERRVE